MKATCIMCPLGCELVVTEKDGKVCVSGNTCKRGEMYGVSEYTHPVRTVTSLVKVEGGGVASVKTTKPIDKNRIFDVLGEIGKLTAPADAKIGDTLLSDVLGLGADVVVTGMSK